MGPDRPGGEAGDDFGRFTRDLAALLDLDATGWAPADGLDLRLRWDSVVALEVVCWLDEQGVHLPDALLAELRTLGDLHHYARNLAPAVTPPPTARRAPRQGPRVHLAPLTAAHHGAALELFTSGDNLVRFRLRGATPSPEAFSRLLWDRVLCQFAVLDGPSLVGLVSAFEPDLRNRHVHVAVVTHHEAPAGAGVEGLGLLIDHLFSEFDLRKVYAEVLEPNAGPLTSGLGRLVTVEGRLVDHEFMGGRYHDMLVLAITRAGWEAHAERLVGV